jgi:hypothetical protein
MGQDGRPSVTAATKLEKGLERDFESLKEWDMSGFVSEIVMATQEGSVSTRRFPHSLPKRDNANGRCHILESR